MRTTNNYLALLMGTVMMLATSAAWSEGGLPQEHTLDPGYYDVTHTPRIDFYDADLKLNEDKKNGGSVFTAKAKNNFELIFPDGTSTSDFDGKFELSATLGSDGSLIDGAFSFISQDAAFGGGGWNTVFSGLLQDIGWSNDSGLIEFQMAAGSMTGWACDVGWCSQANERLWFDLGDDGIGGMSNALHRGREWEQEGVDGVAVIPLPAAVWLFGSGLIGLAGFARRRKS
jgi:hypothetical protein